MQKIVFLDRATLAPQIQLARPAFEHQLIEYDHTQADQVVARLNGATIAITNKVPLTANVIEQLPSLKLVAVAATGTDCVDKEMCERHGIRVSNIRGYAVNTVPEHTFALMLALRRNLIAYRDDVLHGEWQKSGQFCFFNHAIHDLGGMTLGIIGEGVLGQRVAEIAKAFGMHPLFAAHKGLAGLGPLYTPWDEILATSDIITIHSPLTPQTRGMLAMPEFRAMKRKPIIINTARGGLVDEEALVQALDDQLISGVGFDVLTSEPPDANNSLMRIAGRPNVIVTPHVAWASDEAQQSLADQLMENIGRFVRGEPVNLVV